MRDCIRKNYLPVDSKPPGLFDKLRQTRTAAQDHQLAFILRLDALGPIV